MPPESGRAVSVEPPARTAAQSAATIANAHNFVDPHLRLMVSLLRRLVSRRRAETPSANVGAWRFGVSSACMLVLSSSPQLRYWLIGMHSVNTTWPPWTTSISAHGANVAWWPSAFVHLAVDVELVVTLNVTWPFCGVIGPDVPPDWPTTVCPALFVQVKPADTLIV